MRLHSHRGMLLIILTAVVALAGQSMPPPLILPNGASIAVQLKKSVNADKAKVGDEVSAEVSTPVLLDGRIMVPGGAHVVGHVIAAVAHTKDHPESILGIRFERAEWKDGSVPLNAYIVGQLGVKRKRHYASDCFPERIGSLPTGGKSPRTVVPRYESLLASNVAGLQEPPCAVAGPARLDDVIVRTLDDPPGATQLISVKKNVSLSAGMFLELRQVRP